MYGCEIGTIKKVESQRIDAFELWCWRTLESPLHSKEIKPVNPKGNQFWIFTGRTNTEAEAPMLLPPDAKSRLIGKDPDAGKYWRQEEKGMTEDKMAGWHHQFNAHEFEQTLGHSEGQEAWHAAVRGVTKIRHNWAIEQKVCGGDYLTQTHCLHYSSPLLLKMQTWLVFRTKVPPGDICCPPTQDLFFFL